MPVITVPREWDPYVTDTSGNTAGATVFTGKGYARYTPTTVKGLVDAPAAGNAIPEAAKGAMITVKDNPARFRFDATNPTASEGFYVAAGTILIFDNCPQVLRNTRFIDTAAGASEVTVAYFR